MKEETEWLSLLIIITYTDINKGINNKNKDDTKNKILKTTSSKKSSHGYKYLYLIWYLTFKNDFLRFVSKLFSTQSVILACHFLGPTNNSRKYKSRFFRERRLSTLKILLLFDFAVFTRKSITAIMYKHLCI